MDKTALTRQIGGIVKAFLGAQVQPEVKPYKPGFDSRPTGGTPMRGSTVSRLKAQQSAGLSPFRKEVVLADGTIVHPTKGHVYGHRSPPVPFKDEPETGDTLELRRLTDRMTNWQRSGYCRELRMAHVDEQSLAVRLRIAGKWVKQRRRKVEP